MKKTIITLALLVLGASALAQNLNPTVEVTNTYVREAGGITAAVEAVIKNPHHGYAPVTQVFAGDDLYLFQSRRYRWLRNHFRPGGWSFLEFLLKVRDHLFHKV